MALLGNVSVLLKSPSRHVGGVGHSAERPSWNTAGQNKGAQFVDGSAAVLALMGRPNGYYPPVSWAMPRRAGQMVSRNVTTATITASGSGALGVNATGSAGMTFTADAIGQLIVSGSGSASFAITATGLAVATLNGSGSASFAITATATPGALAWAVGSASLAITASATIRAVGNMTGTTDVQTVLTAQGIADSLWGSLATSYNAAGSMGAKLNAAGSGGVDYGALGAAVWAHATRTLTQGAPLDPADAADIAAEVLAVLQATTIPVNMVAVRGQTLDGTGTEADPWGPT